MEVLPDQSVRCPATGFKRSCRKIVSKHTCPKWVSVVGQDPQTGETLPRFGCADTFVHMLLLENAKEIRQLAASVDSLRNKTVASAQLIAGIRDGSIKALDSDNLKERS